MRSTLLSVMMLTVVFTVAAAQQQAVEDTARPATSPPDTGQIEAPVAAEITESPLSIERMTFCAGVEEREPVNESAEFAGGAGTIFFWSNILNEGQETQVEHVWYLNGEEKARVELPIRYPRNRVWSSKIIPPEWDGTWKVEIVTADGKVLGEQTCTVK